MIGCQQDNATQSHGLLITGGAHHVTERTDKYTRCTLVSVWSKPNLGVMTCDAAMSWLEWALGP